MTTCQPRELLQRQVYFLVWERHAARCKVAHIFLPFAKITGGYFLPLFKYINQSCCLGPRERPLMPRVCWKAPRPLKHAVFFGGTCNRVIRNSCVCNVQSNEGKKKKKIISIMQPLCNLLLSPQECAALVLPFGVVKLLSVSLSVCVCRLLNCLGF